MPLSEREQQLLDQIELDLARDDPEYVESVTLEQLRRQQLRGLIIPALTFLVGTVLLIAGLVTTHTHVVAGATVAVIGAVTMGLTAFWFNRHIRR